MSEENRFAEILGEKVQYCDHCNVFITICESCGNSSCNGGGCKSCSGRRFLDDKKIHVVDYLNPEERMVFNKIEALKGIMRRSLNAGESEINWQKTYLSGGLSQLDEELFQKELARIDKSDF